MEELTGQNHGQQTEPDGNYNGPVTRWGPPVYSGQRIHAFRCHQTGEKYKYLTPDRHFSYLRILFTF